MNKRTVRNVCLKAGVMVSTVLFGITVTAVGIAKENITAISNELGQPTSEIVNRSNKVYYESKYNSVKDLKEAGKQLVRDIQAEGTVLLNNKDNALPLNEGAKVSLFGVTSLKPSVGGRGSAHAGGADPATDLYQALAMEGFQTNDVMKKYYTDMINSSYGYKYKSHDVPFYKENDKDTTNVIDGNEELTNSIAEYGDAAIYILTRTGGEASDLKRKVKSNGTVDDDLALKPNEKSIIKGLCELKSKGIVKKVIVLLNTTNQIQSKDFADFDIDATLWIGHVGITGMESVAQLLSGKITPSGHLTDTFWYDHMDNPVMKNFGAYKYTNRTDFDEQLLGSTSTDGYGTYVAYQEGVYLGYRYSETRYTDVVTKRENAGNFDYAATISAPFGFGLSYTDFDFSDYKVDYDAKAKEYTVSVKVTNTGKFAGKEAVQIYLQKPYTDYDIQNKIEKPAVELVGYAKTDTLVPGASEVVSVKVSEENFRVYDRELNKTYIVTEGDYLLTAAEDSHQAANNFLSFKGYAKKDGMTEDGDKAMVAKFHKALDTTTYSVSRGTDPKTGEHNKIKNLFDQADINKLDGHGDNKLEFLSRNNWNKQLNNKLALTQEMVDKIMDQQNPMTIEKDNGEYPTYGADNNLQLIDLMREKGQELSYNDPLWDKLLDQLTYNETVDLISNGLRCSNISEKLGKPKTLDHNGPTGLTEAYGKSETGLAAIKNDPDKMTKAPYYPSIPILASTFNKDLAKRFGDMLGEDSLWAGYNGLYGIGLNTHRSPYAGRHFEYFSEDPFLAGTMAAEEVKALQAHGVNAYIKHFALNDQETQRFGVQVWSNEQALREISLRPYEYAVIDGGAVNAMAAFSRIGLEFAPASHALLTDYLRGELGMKGFVVTDMYTLGYVNEQMPIFLMAGCDLPDGELKAHPYKMFEHGYSNVAWQMREAAKRTLYVTLNSNAMNYFDSETRVLSLTPQWLNQANGLLYGMSAFFGVMLLTAGVVLVVDNRKKFFGKNR